MRSYTKRLNAIASKLYPQPKQERWLPTGVHLYQNEEGHVYYLPGAKETWERSARAGITPDIYLNLLPDEEGCCSCEPNENCSCAEKLWDAIDIPSLERVPEDFEMGIQEYYSKMEGKAL